MSAAGPGMGHEGRIARVEADISHHDHMIRALAALPAQLATVTEAQANLTRAVGELKATLQETRAHFDEEVGKLSKRLEEMEDDRVTRFRWLVGVLGVAAMIVLTTLGLLFG